MKFIKKQRKKVGKNKKKPAEGQKMASNIISVILIFLIIITSYSFFKDIKKKT